MSPIVNYSSATGQYSLIIVGSGNPSWIWSKWYQGPTEPDVLDPNPFVGVAAGATTWHAQQPNNGSQVFGPQTVTPTPNNGIKLVVWELQNDGSTFAIASAWEPPHSSSGNSSSNPPASSFSSSSSNSNNGTISRPTPNPSKKRRDDDVVPVDIVQE